MTDFFHALDMFRDKIDGIMRRTPAERRTACECAISTAVQGVSGSKRTVGQIVGPRLKKIEEEFVPKEPSKSQEEKLAEMRQLDILDDRSHAAMRALLGQRGTGTVIEATYGQVERFRAHGANPKPGDVPLINAYTQIEGFLFEASRIDLARSWGYTTLAHHHKTRVDFIGIRNGSRTNIVSSPIDIDVPYIQNWIWEVKRYTRHDFGTSDESLNQVLKYQAALQARRPDDPKGHAPDAFQGATLEITGNVSPAFIRLLVEHPTTIPATPAPLVFAAPNLEVLYTFPDGTSVPLKHGARDRSLRRRGPWDQHVEVALLRYDHNNWIFSGGILGRDDVRDDAELCAHVDEAIDRLDPTTITDLHVFRRYEAAIWKRRLALLARCR